tara:strand:+ start:250 stop:525 length:276 start_codon:yes stop_codon:yes gene_type:complete
MKNKEEIISELSLERRELLGGALNRSDMSRIGVIDNQLFELIGDDSFRSHELQDNAVFVDSTQIYLNLGEGLGDQDHGFVSESFHDPNLDY